MYRDDLDLDAIVNRLATRGLGPATAPFVEEVILSHVRERGDETMKFEDLLLGLTQIGKKNVAFLLLEETGAWLGELPNAEEHISQAWRHDGCRPFEAGYGEARQRALRSAIRAPSAQPYGFGGVGAGRASRRVSVDLRAAAARASARSTGARRRLDAEPS